MSTDLYQKEIKSTHTRLRSFPLPLARFGHYVTLAHTEVNHWHLRQTPLNDRTRAPLQLSQRHLLTYRYASHLKMASRLLHSSLFTARPSFVAAGLAGTSLLLLPQITSYRRAHLLRLDSSPSPVSPKDWSFSQYQHDARTPVVDSKGGLNARAVRQMSLGSIIGAFAHN